MTQLLTCCMVELYQIQMGQTDKQTSILVSELLGHLLYVQLSAALNHL